MSQVSQRTLLVYSPTHFFSVVALALAIPTVLITIIRLGVRARGKNLGLDDAFAASSLVGLVVTYVGYFLHSDPHRMLPGPVLSHKINRFIFPPVLAHFSFTTRYMMYYTLSLGFYWAIWYPFSASLFFSFPHAKA